MQRLPIFDFLNTSFKTFKIGNLNIAATYWEAGAIILLLFLLVFTLARLRHLYVHWSMGKNAWAMLFWGVVLTVIVEAFLMLSGRTIFTEIMGVKNVPKPFSTVLDIGRNRLTNVLGEDSEIPQSYAESKLNSDQMYSLYMNMEVSESQKLQEIICTP
jgi:hypothetical protein